MPVPTRHDGGMKRLYLLRHAKSSWKDASLADHDRPLSGRGRRAAKAIGRYMREQDIEPELVLCSTAQRARETLARVEPALGGGAVKVERRLYGARAEVLIARLRRLSPDLGSVMLIGHNPELQVLALELARPAPMRASVAERYPTGALVTLQLAGDDWRELGQGSCELTAFVRPRELEAGS